MALRAIFLVALAAVLFIGIVRADDDPKLPGSTVKMEDAVSKADAVFIGEITQMGLATPTSPNMATFEGTKVKVTQVLRGSVDAQISVSIAIFGENSEVPPEVGIPYIFFIHKDTEVEGNRLAALKLLPATKDNEKTVIFAILRAKANAKLLEIENDKK